MQLPNGHKDWSHRRDCCALTKGRSAHTCLESLSSWLGRGLGSDGHLFPTLLLSIQILACSYSPAVAKDRRCLCEQESHVMGLHSSLGSQSAVCLCLAVSGCSSSEGGRGRVGGVCPTVLSSRLQANLGLLLRVLMSSGLRVLDPAGHLFVHTLFSHLPDEYT